jgi:hypothetical protein
VLYHDHGPPAQRSYEMLAEPPERALSGRAPRCRAPAVKTTAPLWRIKSAAIYGGREIAQLFEAVWVASREWGQQVWLVAWAVAGICESRQMGMHVVGLGNVRLPR